MRSSPPAEPCRPPFNANMANPGALEVIHNGRNAGEFIASEKEPFVLSLGRTWDEGKNLALLEKAAPMIPWPVVIAGASGVAPQEKDQESFHHARYLGPLGSGAVRTLLSRRRDLCAARALRTLRSLGARGRLVGCRPDLGRHPELSRALGRRRALCRHRRRQPIEPRDLRPHRKPRAEGKWAGAPGLEPQRFSIRGDDAKILNLYESLASEESRVSTSPGDLCA